MSKRGRPKLHVTKHSINLPIGLAEKLDFIYPNMGLSQAIRLIAEAHIAAIEAEKGPMPSVAGDIDKLLRDNNLELPSNE